MSDNETIEQSDVPEQKDKQKQGAYKPSDFGYKKFEPGERKEALAKAKTGGDKDSEVEAGRLEAELASIDGDSKKTLKPQEVRSLDESVRLSDEERKGTKKNVEVKEKHAFSQILKTLQETPNLPIKSEGENHMFEFTSLTQDGKVVESKEVKKMLEHVDQGGEVPPNVEFQFHTSFKKGRDETENVDVDYRVSLQQIMRDGLETTLSSLLSLSYAAASNYDAKRAKMVVEGGKVEVEKPKPAESGEENPLDSLRKQLSAAKVQTSSIQTGQWKALEVSLPEKQKQLSIVYDGAIFQVTEKSIDKTVELPIQSPAEILHYIEKESK